MSRTVLAPVMPGLIISFFAIVVGTSLGMAFGLYEEPIRDYLTTQIKAHPEAHDQAPDAVNRDVNKAWRDIQRAHFHSQGLGALGVGIILVLSLSWVSAPVKRWVALATGLGALLYPFCWLLMGLRVGPMGAEAAHASVDWLAGVSVPLFFGGMLLTLLILVLGWLFPDDMPGVLKKFSSK
ncbi:MAG TPA: hypothetical protein VEI24_08990 [Nitrospiria bacterium]|nr:hypothetical protein [Nitrospiria bacterium]